MNVCTRTPANGVVKKSMSKTVDLAINDRVHIITEDRNGVVTRFSEVNPRLVYVRLSGVKYHDQLFWRDELELLNLQGIDGE